MRLSGKLNRKQIKAIEYYCRFLFSKQLLPYIDISVKFKSFKNSQNGEIAIDDYNSKGQPRSFVLFVNSADSPKEKLITLAHELVHARQYAYGELHEYNNVWRGREYDVDKIYYDELPWEVEAESLGQELYYSFVGE